MCPRDGKGETDLTERGDEPERLGPVNEAMNRARGRFGCEMRPCGGAISSGWKKGGRKQKTRCGVVVEPWAMAKWWPVRASEGVATERFALENIFAYFAFKVSICD